MPGVEGKLIGWKERHEAFRVRLAGSRLVSDYRGNFVFVADSLISERTFTDNIR
jgi:hypothetical protein